MPRAWAVAAWVTCGLVWSLGLATIGLAVAGRVSPQQFVASFMALGSLSLPGSSCRSPLGSARSSCSRAYSARSRWRSFRYQLHDIDRLLNRILVYGLVTAILGTGYAALVLVFGQLLGRDRSSFGIAGATLVAAGLFQPLRRRVQQAADRRFDRRRYDAARTIERFSGRLREEVDLDMLSGELLGVVDQTMEPTTVWLWLRPQAGPSYLVGCALVEHRLPDAHAGSSGAAGRGRPR